MGTPPHLYHCTGALRWVCRFAAEARAEATALTPSPSLPICAHLSLNLALTPPQLKPQPPPPLTTTRHHHPTFPNLQEFMRQTGCGVEDATIYLDLLGWNVVAALREYSGCRQKTARLRFV